MKLKSIFILTALAGIVILYSGCKKTPLFPCDCTANDLVVSTSVYATGLNNPRGLRFGPDAHLYVAEGGVGGINSSALYGCTQVPGPIGPYFGSDTGARISEIVNGNRITVADKLPSSVTSQGQVSGVGDIEFIGNTLYGILAGAGCSHGVPDIPNGVVKVLPNKKWQLVANLSEFVQNYPIANPDLEDFEPDGTWYSMVNVANELYATEPNHQEIDRISPYTGKVNRFIDLSLTFPGDAGWKGPTSLIYHEGAFYFGTLGKFPIVSGDASVYKLTPDGKLTTYATGFETILGIAFDQFGALYVLENTTGNQFPTPGTGDVIRIDPTGERTTIVTGLNLPTAMIVGPDDKLYISNWGYGGAIGDGQILQVSVTCRNKQSSDIEH
jgi:hypothetical protein